MLTIAAFASLAQLGSGLALALALFIEPIAMRERRARERLDNALKLVPRNADDAAEVRRGDILLKVVDLNDDAESAQKQAKWPLLLIKLGAAINFAVLLAATICPEAEVSEGWMWSVLAMLVLPVAGGYGWSVTIARRVIRMPDS